MYPIRGFAALTKIKLFIVFYVLLPPILTWISVQRVSITHSFGFPHPALLTHFFHRETYQAVVDILLCRIGNVPFHVQLFEKNKLDTALHKYLSLPVVLPPRAPVDAKRMLITLIITRCCTGIDCINQDFSCIF